jgi:plastocyanin
MEGLSSMDRTRCRPLALIIGVALVAGCATSASQAAPTGSLGAIATSSPVASPSPVTPSVQPTPTTEPTASVAALSADPDAPASNVTVKLSVVTRRFVQTDLTAPAGKTWQLEIDDQGTEAVMHNFTVMSGQQRVYQTPFWGHGLSHFVVGGLPAGTYLFICTIHPGPMRGALEIK